MCMFIGDDAVFVVFRKRYKDSWKLSAEEIWMYRREQYGEIFVYESISGWGVAGVCVTTWWLEELHAWPAYFFKQVTIIFLCFSKVQILLIWKKVCFFIAGFFYLIGTQPVYRVLTTIFAMIGKFGISASFAVIYIYSAELLPTVVR